uniref:Uncharacterized protein n=1 Tax=Parascaris univalens TaxID=6257 RepID=A0A915B0E1_PARUN
MYLTKHATALGKNAHLGLQPRFLFQIKRQRYVKIANFRKSVLCQLPMKPIRQDSMSDMKSLVKELGIFQFFASTRPLTLRNSLSPTEILKSQLNAKTTNPSSPR